MRRRRGTMPFSYIIIFILAFVLAGLAVLTLPIPAKFKSLIFFLLVVVLAFIGVLVVSKIKRK